MRIVEELMEIWPNEVCDNPVKVFSKVILERINVNETLSSTQGCSKTGKSTDSSE